MIFAAACGFFRKVLQIRHSTLKILLSAIAVLVWTAGVHAQSNGLYLSGGIGGVLPLDSDLENRGITSETSFDPGLVGSLAFGSTLDDNWRTDVEASYRSSDIEEVKGLANGSGSISGSALMFNGYYDFNSGSDWQPYVGAGVGLIRLKLDDASLVGGGRIDDDSWSAAAQGIAGVGYRINEQLGLFTDYRFLAALEHRYTSSARTKVDAEYSEHRIMIGLRWSFGSGKTSSTTQTTPAKSAAAAPLPAAKSAVPRRAEPEPVQAKQAAKVQAPATKSPDTARRYLLFFGWERAKLSREARDIVGDAAKAQEQLPRKIIKATGHTDRSGPDSFNMLLSKRRAEAVKGELMRLGIPADGILIDWKGEREPMVKTADGARELKNRRVEIILQ